LNSSPETCVFCQIIHQSDPASILFEDNVSLAFLDKRPLFAGHTLLIPKIHFELFSDLPQELIGKLFFNAQILEKAVRTAMNAEGSFIAANNKISQSVPHFHIHIVPRNHKDGLKGFFWPRTTYRDDTEKLKVLIKIKNAISSNSSHAADV
jgi:histidine triad (HIT) family protein